MDLVTNLTVLVFAMTSTMDSIAMCIVSRTLRAMAMASAVLKACACAANFISEKIAA